MKVARIGRPDDELIWDLGFLMSETIKRRENKPRRSVDLVHKPTVLCE
uniref:Uncharacterized protein n=1 Tax=Rhizophora mucronata TaxID=61149 RepID=A0A2P2QK30_RHIMU